MYSWHPNRTMCCVKRVIMCDIIVRKPTSVAVMHVKAMACNNTIVSQALRVAKQAQLIRDHLGAVISKTFQKSKQMATFSRVCHPQQARIPFRGRKSSVYIVAFATAILRSCYGPCRQLLE